MLEIEGRHAEGYALLEPGLAAAPPPPPVIVTQPVIQTVTDYLVFTGKTQAVMSANVNARVAGILDQHRHRLGGGVDRQRHAR